MEHAPAQDPVGFFIGMVLGAVGVGLLCGLVPLAAGSFTKQKKLGISGFFACLIARLIAGALLAIPTALGFTIAIVIKWKNTPESNEPSTKSDANDT